MLDTGPPMKQITKDQFTMLGLDLLAYVQKGQTPLVCVDRLPSGASNTIFAGKGPHKNKLAEALKGKIQQYEWIAMDSSVLFQTIMLPLPTELSSLPTVLITTRNITGWIGDPVEVKPIDYGLREARSVHTFSQVLLAAREEEKRTLSKALHDEIGSAAVILTSLLRIIRANVENANKKKALDYIKELDGQIKNCIERIKNIVVSMRPPSLEQDGALCQSIRELVENVSHYAQVSYTFDCNETMSEQGVSDRIKILLYRIVQEALNNVVKHAQAHSVYLSLQRNNDQFLLVVQDDGIGFSKPKQSSIAHIGLLAMRDSVNLIGGTISIKSTKGKGTRIEVSCPCFVYEEQI